MRKAISLVIVFIALAGFVSIAWQGTAASEPQKSGGTAGGNAVYKEHCAKCHGADGKGLESLQPPDFTDAKWQAERTDKDLADGIKNGKGIMPGYKETLSAAKINGLVKYIRKFAPANKKK